MASQEIETLSTFPAIDHTGLVRVQHQTELTKQRFSDAVGLLSLTAGRTQHHEIVRVADQFADTMLGPGRIERM